MSTSNKIDDPNKWDRVLHNYNLITFDDSIDQTWGLIENGTIAIRNGKIGWVGSQADWPPAFEASETQDGGGQYITPGLIDCHSHAVFGGGRADEWQRRLQGVSYEQIAREGGGILSTVRATRSHSTDRLIEQSRKRVESMICAGVTTLEIKSGYGLDLETEIKMLTVAKMIGEQLPVDVHPTLLGAHAVPPEFKGRSDQYVDLVCREMIPAATSLATAVDVFTENIGFDLKQTERVFQTATDAGFNVKIHAEQLSNMNGAKLAAEYNAISADHLEYLDENGIVAMAEHGTVATLLPGAFYFIKETQKPPVKLLREHSVPIAIATDLNPGSSPVVSPLLMANMACTFFGMTPSESLRGITVNAARALRIQNRVGTIAVGQQADLACWDVQSPAELAFMIGHNPVVDVIKDGISIVSATSLISA